MTESRKLRVFLCHSSQDKPIVRELYQRLLTEGWIDPWLDEEKLLPGQDWDLEIEKAVEDADAVVVCLSTRSVSKEGYIQKELKFALDIALTKPEETIFIVPLRLDDCQVPRRLRDKHYTDYFPVERMDRGFKLLQSSLRERLKSLGLSASSSDANVLDLAQSLSSKIISKKFFDARLALQNDQLSVALEIFGVLTRQGIGLKEIISDLLDVSIIYSENKELWVTLGNAYKMAGDIEHAEECYKKVFNTIDSNNNRLGSENVKKKELPKEPENYIPSSDQQPTSSLPFLLSTVSIETLGGVSTPVFYKAGLLPLKNAFTYSTATDNQEQIEIHLVLGENSMAKDNASIGRFIFGGIQPAPKGVPQIEILVEINRELELSITATNKTSGKTQNYELIKLNSIVVPPVKDPLPLRSDPILDKMFDSSGGFSDFFQTVFGMNAKQSSLSQPQGYQQRLELTLEEVCMGSVRRVLVDGKEKVVRIPAGVRTGSKVRIAGAAPSGGDLYLNISVHPHKLFTRDGEDLYMWYPISEKLASHGGGLQVPVLDKSKFMYIKIPPNTKNKHVFRYPNKGIPYLKNPKELGDFYLIVDVYDTSKKHQELLDEIKNYMQ